MDEEMAAAVRYVRKRDGVFQYHRRVPKAVLDRPAKFEELFDSRALFRRSLKTKNHADMHISALEIHRQFEDRLAKALGRSERGRQPVQVVRRKVTNADVNALSERYRDLTVRRYEQALLHADSSPAGAEEWQRLQYELEVDAADIVPILRTPGTRAGKNAPIEAPISTAASVIEKQGYDAPIGSPAYGAIVAGIRAGIEQGYKYVEELRSGSVVPRIPERFNEKTRARLTIREAITQYISKKKLPPKTTSEVNLALKTFETVVGNKTLDALTRTDFLVFVEHMAGQTVGGNSAGSVKRPMAAQTIKKRLGFLSAAINHAIDREEFIGANPASGIKVGSWVTRADPAIVPKKRPFKTGELNQIFQYPWFTGCHSASNTHRPGAHRLTGAEYWVPIVALWSGCRASELGGLRLAEVMIDDPHPHFAIRDNQYRSTKGGYARDVPILDRLMEFGFTEYVQRVRTAGADRLFPDWESPRRTGDFNKDDAAWSNAKLIRAFNRTVIPKALEGSLLKDARREVTFHSFRGAFKSMLGLSPERPHPNIINEVMGHAKSELDRRYVGKIPIEETYEVIRGCRFKGLAVASPA